MQLKRVCIAVTTWSDRALRRVTTGDRAHSLLTPQANTLCPRSAVSFGQLLKTGRATTMATMMRLQADSVDCLVVTFKCGNLLIRVPYEGPSRKRQKEGAV